VRAIVAVVDVVEDLFATIVFDVDVDVGCLGLASHPALGEEPLEHEPVRDRIDGRDAQANTRTAELAALPRPCARIPFDSANCTASHMTRKNPGEAEAAG